MTRPHRPAQAEAERGSVTVFFLVTTAAIIAALGLAADVGETLAISAQVTDEAEQAARIGADQLNLADLRAGHITIDPATATAAAQTYLRQFGDTGTVTVHGTDLDVSAQRPILAQFLEVLGVPGLTARGAGAATDIPGVAGPNDLPAVLAGHTSNLRRPQP